MSREPRQRLRPLVEQLESRALLSIAPSGIEGRVNVSLLLNQHNSRAAMDDSGKIVVVWQDASSDGSSNGIYVRRFDADGIPLTNELRVNTYTADSQETPDIAMDGAGNFAVVWRSDFQDGSFSGIYAQRFDAAVNKVGTEFRVNVETNDIQQRPSIAMDRSGKFIVSWQSKGQDGAGEGIFMRRYDASATALSGDVRVNGETGNDQIQPTIALDDDGDAVVAWASNDVNSTGGDVYARLVSKTGVLGTAFRVNGTLTGDQVRPNVAMDSAGNFTVVWDGPNATNTNRDVYMRRYDANGTPRPSGEVRLNATTPGNQDSPQIAKSGDGAEFIVWQSDHLEGAFVYNAIGRVFDSAGVEIYPESLINTTTFASQDTPAIAMNIRQDAAAFWNTFGQDANFYEVYGQRFDSTGAPVDIRLSPNVVPENSANNTVVGTVTAIDPDVNDTTTLDLIDNAGGRFTLDGDQIKVANGLLLNFESASSHTIRVRATDNDNNVFEKNILIQITNVNEQPTNIVLSNTSIAESSPNDTVVGTLTGADPDGDTMSFTLLDSASGRFKIVGNELRVANGTLLNFEQNTSHGIQVRVTDGVLTFTKNFTIAVTNANDLPTNIGLSGTTVAENSAVNAMIGSLSATDEDAGETFTYSLTNNAGGRFKIVGSQLQVANSALLDFETSASHAITVKVTDSKGGVFTKNFTITLTNVDETPSNIFLSNSIIAEHSALGTVIGTLSTTPDAGDTHTFSLVNNAGGRFSITGTQLKVANKDLLNFEVAPTYTIRVRVKDLANHIFEKDLVITVRNVNEPPFHVVPTNTQVLYRNGSLKFQAPTNGLRVWDIDAGTNPLRMTLSVTRGKLSIGSFAGLRSVVGNNSSLVTVEGTLWGLNNALNGLTYLAPPSAVGGVTLTLSTNDLGHSGIGSALTGTNSVFMVIINRRPDAPLPGLGSTFTYQTTRNRALDQPVAWGVVRGKRDIDGDVVTAEVVTRPSVGSLTFRPDGSFRYVPPTNFVGTVTFTVRYFDGIFYSNNVATVIMKFV